jgi:hypothetical protein
VAKQVGFELPLVRSQWFVVSCREIKLTTAATDKGPLASARKIFAFGQPSPESEALQKTIDDGAPADQIKAALQKVRETPKRKQADLVKAQEELRQVVTTRQEAVLVSFGTLD